jgi:uncharacterized membrane protein
MDIAATIATWLHALATVIVLGYYGILGRIVLPALVRSVEGPALGRAIGAVERRALPLLVVSVGLFVVTGFYLLVVDEAFAGLGNFGSSSWATLMLAKHALIGFMVAGGGLVHFLVLRVDDPALPDDERLPAVRHLRLAAEAMTGLGALILLLTAAAQAG